MKIKIILTGWMIVSFMACTNDNKTGLTSVAQTDTAHPKAEEDPSVGLSLNKGEKWQTDESTWVHSANLNALVAAFHKNEPADIASYQVLGSAMQEELGGLVKDCKMKGEDHDALHSWLEPVMKDVNDLIKAGTVDEGKNIVETLTTDVEKFNQYFENAD